MRSRPSTSSCQPCATNPSQICAGSWAAPCGQTPASGKVGVCAFCPLRRRASPSSDAAAAALPLGFGVSVFALEAVVSVLERFSARPGPICFFDCLSTLDNFDSEALLPPPPPPAESAFFTFSAWLWAGIAASGEVGVFAFCPLRRRASPSSGAPVVSEGAAQVLLEHRGASVIDGPSR